MKLKETLCVIGLIGLTTAITSRVVSQDKAPSEYGQEMPQWMKYAMPGEQHKQLEPFVGRWEQTVKFWMEPGAEPGQSYGSAEYKWIMGGRFLQGTYEGQMEGNRFEGMDVIGYDNFRNEYISFWIDNHTTSFMVARGSYDPNAKTITMRGKHDDTMHGKKDKPFRTVTTIEGNDKLVYEMFTLGPDGKEFKVLQVTSTRRE